MFRYLLSPLHEASNKAVKRSGMMERELYFTLRYLAVKVVKMQYSTSAVCRGIL